MAESQLRSRVSTECRELMTGYFRSLNAGGEYVLNLFPGLFREEVERMKGRFTADELEMLIYGLESIAGHYGGKPMLNPAVAGFQAAQALQVQGGSKALQEKIGSMSRFTVVCLEIWCIGFWYQEESLKRYSKALLVA